MGITGNKITGIIEISYFEDPYAIGLNLEAEQGRPRSALVNISSDAETIYYNGFEGHLVPKADIDGAIYKDVCEGDDTELARFLGKTIQSCKFGIAQEFGTNEDVLHYLRCNTDNDEFLFFNNGDEAAWPVNKTAEVLSDDLCALRWSENPPASAADDVSWLIEIR
jgi:hypothetical protein